MPSAEATTESSPNPENLVWIDLEMTGLDPSVDVILQAALIVTSRDLDTLAEVAAERTRHTSR